MATRIRLVISIGLIALSTAGCSTLTGADHTVDVDGQGYTSTEADALFDEYFAKSEIFGTTPLDSGGFGDADRARLLLNAMVRSSSVRSILDRSGDDITDGDLDLYFATLPSENPINELSEQMRELIAMTSVDVITSALARAELPDADELEEMYLSAPVSTGLLCLRHILVETEQEANVIVDELRDGADFAELAAERSLEGSASITGGALTGTESQCLPTAQYISGFDADFVAAAFAAPATTWSHPVETQFGWHVILNRPWSEVGSDVIASYASPDGPLFYVDAVLNSADVTVDSRYGRWDPASGRIVPLG